MRLNDSEANSQFCLKIKTLKLYTVNYCQKETVFLRPTIFLEQQKSFNLSRLWQTLHDKDEIKEESQIPITVPFQKDELLK